MKKIFILILAATLSLGSCKDFLTIIPSDARFHSEVPAIKQTMGAWLQTYRNTSKDSRVDSPQPWLISIHNSAFAAYTDVYTFHTWGNLTNFGETHKRLLGRSQLNWNLWAQFYNIIGYMNLCISDLETANGDDDMRNYVRGEALMHRAFAFFKLLQYYSPIDDASLGVPIHLDPYQGFDEANLQRQSQQAVYNQIFSDLREVERLLEITHPRPTYNIKYNYDHLYRIMAQVYLWKASGPAAEDSDWANAATAAKNAIAQTENQLPWDVTRLRPLFGTAAPITYFYLESYHGTAEFMGYPETLLWHYGANLAASIYPNYGYDLDLWRELYKNNDLRKTRWFLAAANYNKDPMNIVETELQVSMKFNIGTGMHAVMWFRLAEQYLILLEAYAHTDFNAGKALLPLWQSVRYAPGTQAEWFVPANARELLEEVLRERRREFVLEGDILWLDMKRFKVASERPSVHGYTAPALTSDDIRYQFMIPSSETETNTTIIQNPGWGQYFVID